MALFGRAASKEQAPSPVDSYAERVRLIAEDEAAFEKLARETEVDERARAPDRMAAFHAHHERDANSYQFRCERFGDFLTVYISRERFDYARSVLSLEKFSTSLNLGKTTMIHLNTGNMPDENGVITYFSQYSTVDGSGSCVGPISPPPGYRRQVHPRVSNHDLRPPFIEEAKDRDSDRHGLIENTVRYKTRNYPRPASDDRIHFGGIGTSICVPAGLGESVLAKIMAEITSGAPLVAMPTAPATP